jgi:hypothetical protein
LTISSSDRQEPSAAKLSRDAAFRLHTRADRSDSLRQI